MWSRLVLMLRALPFCPIASTTEPSAGSSAATAGAGGGEASLSGGVGAPGAETAAEASLESRNAPLTAAEKIATVMLSSLRSGRLSPLAEPASSQIALYGGFSQILINQISF